MLHGSSLKERREMVNIEWLVVNKRLSLVEPFSTGAVLFAESVYSTGPWGMGRADVTSFTVHSLVET